MTTQENPPPMEPEAPHPEAPLPVAAARIAMLKASYRQAWLYFLLAVSLIVAWWFPAQNALRQMLAHRPVETGPRDATAFLALAYEGISDQPAEVSPQQFREHMDALRQAGFVPITLSDVQALLTEGKPVPRKSVLLTFDQSRKSSYFEARSVLQRIGWSAVMFLWTQPIEEGEPASLRWPYIRRMLRAGAWELGAQSHRGFETVLADPSGRRGNFMTTPMWIETERRLERPEEFMKRVASDHETVLRILRRETGREPVAFAFPYGDFGQRDERALLTRRFNLDYVDRFYDLGFILGSAGLNTRQSDPRRLHRMLVRPEWSAAELARRLESALPRTEGYASAEALSDPHLWLADWGDFSLRSGHALLSAATNTTGAKVWLNGSDTSRDFHVHLRFRPDLGQLGLFLRASPDGESHVYLGLEPDGSVWLRQKHAGMPPFTLASGRFLPDSSGEVELNLFIRDNLVYAIANERPVFDEIPKVRGVPRIGMFGLSVWHPVAGAGRVSLSEFNFRPIHPTAIGWAPVHLRGPELSSWLSRNAYRYTHLSPPWLRMAARGPTEQMGWIPRLMATLASVYRMKFVPEIRVDESAALELTSPEAIVARAAELAPHGVFLNLAHMEGSLALPRLTAWVQTLGRSLGARGIRLLVRFPPAFEQSATLPAIVGVLPNLQLAVTGDSSLAGPEARTGTGGVVRAESAILPVEDMNLALYYELADLFVSDTEWSAEIRAELLRQEGFAAFSAGDFSRAIEIWTRWSELESFNAEPVSLIGDVYLRRGELDQARAYYARSLEMNPGQIDLALRLAHLRDSSGFPEEAMRMLNLYARIFPHNPEIALAQAEWLVRRGRRREAGDRIRAVLEQFPEDLRAMTMLHPLLPTPAERIRNMRALVRLGSRPGLEESFALAIRDRNLATLPESWLLMEFLERMARTAPPERQDLYRNLLPLEREITENFRLGPPSENWVSSSEPDLDARGGLLVGATPAQTEAYLRLVRSDAMRDGYMEATIDEARGFFWLYARRSESSMVRFGFDQTGNVFLQVWKEGQIISNETRFGTWPSGPVTLRLEVRADGAVGLVNGLPFFSAPVAIPRDMALGWWGLAPWAPQFGLAQALVQKAGGGPLPVQIGILSADDERSRGEYLLELLRPHIRHLTAVTPRWFAQELDGSLRKETVGDHTDLRIFCRFHRIRLLPAIRGAAPLSLRTEDLIRTAREEHVDGFLLHVLQLPSDDWFRKTEDELIGSGITLAVVAIDEEARQVQIREVSAGLGLFAGPRAIRTLPLRIAAELRAEEGEPEPVAPASDSVLLL